MYVVFCSVISMGYFRRRKRGDFFARYELAKLSRKICHEATALSEEHFELKIEDGEVFVCMRYWHPMSAEIVEKVMHFAPDHIVLMPLYPQHSTTTTGSSLQEWKKASEKAKLIVSTSAICCYPTEDGWIKAQVQLLENSLAKVSKDRKPRVLFSAHGLPETKTNQQSL